MPPPTLEQVGKKKIVDSSPSYHPLFNSPDADIILQSSEGTLYRVPEITLRMTLKFFADMFKSSRSSTSGRSDMDIIALSEPDKVLEKLLMMISGFGVPQWQMPYYEDVENVLLAAQKYDGPGAISTIRSSITSPTFLADSLRLYALAARFGWEDEARIAAKHTVGLSLFDGKYDSILSSIPSPYLLRLINFHRRRRDVFKSRLDEPFTLATVAMHKQNCPKCGKAKDNSSWQALKMAMFTEMDRRPAGDFLQPVSVGEWPAAKACWEARCQSEGCDVLVNDRIAVCRHISFCISTLDITI